MPIRPELHSAAKILCEELAGHLRVLESTLSEVATADNAPALLAQQASTLEHRFHTLKGGAGFLQLKKIQELGKKGEDLFKGGTVHGNSEQVYASLKEIVTGLKKEYQSLTIELNI